MKNILINKTFDILMNHSSDGIQVLDQDGKIVLCNQKVANLDGIDIADVVGKHLLYIYPSLNPETSTILKVLENGELIIDAQQTFTTYMGKSITTVNTTIPIMDGTIVIGAVEISKNITEVKKLSEKLVDLRSRSMSKKENLMDHGAIYRYEDIITEDDKMKNLLEISKKASLSDIPIMIYGETGTGKELLAQSIHNDSRRKDQAFVAQNCAALPNTLLEGILFGTVKGGFTGAIDRPGLLEMADGGTMFLDEINSMPMELQSKLLRVLQDKHIRRIGDTKLRKVDIRIITAINTDPIKAVEQGSLRKDLYYRLNTVMLRLPDLKERKGDIPLLTKYFMEKHSSNRKTCFKDVSTEVMEIFMKYPWPGNIRELEHVIEAGVSICDGEIFTKDYLPYNLVESIKYEDYKENEMTLGQKIDKYERDIIQMSFITNDKNVTRTAESLGIPRQTLQYKIKKYRIL
jgi:arginine utilization regulatory protein